MPANDPRTRARRIKNNEVKLLRAAKWPGALGNRMRGYKRLHLKHWRKPLRFPNKSIKPLLRPVHRPKTSKGMLSQKKRLAARRGTRIKHIELIGSLSINKLRKSLGGGILNTKEAF
jgi:hypothetical protein